MYCDGPLFRPQGEDLERLMRSFGYIFVWIGPCLLLARRQPLLRLHPLPHSRLAITDRPTNPDEWRAVTTHARLGEPRRAHAEKVRYLLWRQQAFDAAVGLAGGNGHDVFA